MGHIERLNRKEMLPSSFKSVAVVGKGQIGTLLHKRFHTVAGNPTIYQAGRGEIYDMMSQNPEVVIITTPNPVNEVLAEIAKGASRPFTLVLPQNGVGVIDQAVNALHGVELPIPLVRASLYLTVSWFENKPEKDILYDPDKLRIALAPQYRDDKMLVVPKTAKLFRDSGFEVMTFGDYVSLEWTKLLTNCLGSTSTVTGMTPLETFSDEELFKAELRGLRDRIAIMKGLSIDIFNIPWAKGDMLRLSAKLLPEQMPGFMRKLVAKAVAAARDNQPSAAARKIMAGEDPNEVLCYHQPFIDASKTLGKITPVDEATFIIVRDHIRGDINLRDMSTTERRQLLLDKISSLLP